MALLGNGIRASSMKHSKWGNLKEKCRCKTHFFSVLPHLECSIDDALRASALMQRCKGSSTNEKCALHFTLPHLLRFIDDALTALPKRALYVGTCVLECGSEPSSNLLSVFMTVISFMILLLSAWSMAEVVMRNPCSCGDISAATAWAIKRPSVDISPAAGSGLAAERQTDRQGLPAWNLSWKRSIWWCSGRTYEFPVFIIISRQAYVVAHNSGLEYHFRENRPLLFLFCLFDACKWKGNKNCIARVPTVTNLQSGSSTYPFRNGLTAWSAAIQHKLSSQDSGLWLQ